MAFNRELSQFAAYLSLDAAANYIGITTANTTNVGIGKTNPTSKLEVVGDAKVTGVVTATTFVGALTGNASSATALQNARDFQVTGDAASTAISFDGTANVGLAVTLANTGVVAGSYGSSTAIPTFTVDSKGRLTAAGTASVGAALTVTGDTGSETINFLSENLAINGGTNLNSSASSNAVTINLDDNISVTSVVASGVATAAQFKTGATGSAIGISTNTISGPATITLDPAGVGDNTGTVVIAGNLQVDGTTTTINSTTVTVDDKNIVLADGAINDAAADGAGFTVTSGDGNKTFQFEATGDNFGSSEHLNLASGKGYKINNTEVLSSSTLGSGVVNSSLTSVGTLTRLLVGNVNSSGIVTATGGFAGNLTGNVTGNADTATTLQTARDFSISGDATASAISFNGSANVGLALTLANTGVTAGSYGSSTQIPTFTVDSKGRLTAAGTASVGAALTVAGDSGTETINFLNENLTIAGTAGIITTSAASNTVTLNLVDTGVSAGSYGSSTAIPTFTVDAKGRLTAAGTAAIGAALTVAGDSGTETINFLSENLTIAGGTNLTSSAASNTVTINLDDNISLTSVVASGVATAAQFKTGASGQAIGINTNTISGPSQITIDPAGVGDNTGLVVIKGDLQIDGTTTTVNSTTVTVDDKNIVLASGAANDAAADGGGITVESGDGNKTWNWVDSTDSWTSSEHINALSGKVYKINGTEVLSSSTLGSGVVNSSLTSVGTLTQLNVGNVNSTGIVTATGGFAGNLTGNVTGNVTGNINSSGMSTVTNLTVGGYISIGNTHGIANQVLASVGAGVTWKSIADVLPQARTTQTNTATANQTAFSFTYNVNYLDVFVNGVKLASSEFTATNGSNITLNEGAFAGDVVEFVSYSTVGAGSGTVSSLNDLSDVTLASNTAGNVLAYTGSEWVNTSNLNVGIVTCTSVTASGDIAAANFNSTSDVNLKENIRPIENASELVSKLEGVHFTWKESGAETCGVIAQQIEEHLPQLVHTGEDHKSVNYNGLVGVLLAAVKEQGTQIAALQAEIEELKK